MKAARRYEIHLANLDPTVGAEISKTRPVVIVSGDLMNRHLRTVVTCPLTTQLHPSWRSRLQVKCEGRPAEIAVDQIRTLSKSRLIKKLDQLDDRMPAICGFSSRRCTARDRSVGNETAGYELPVATRPAMSAQR